MLKDKKSPWYEVIDWTKDGEDIRKNFIKKKINLEFIQNYFTNLRLNDLKVGITETSVSLNINSKVFFYQIEIIDENLNTFTNLKELILTCNLIKECDSSNLPDSLEVSLLFTQ